jgi:hypothetical protein
MVIGVLGTEDHLGVFHVIDIVFPTMNIQKHLETKQVEMQNWVAFVSGLEFGNYDNDLNLLLLSDYLSGETGQAEVDYYLILRSVEILSDWWFVEIHWPYRKITIIH